MCLAFASIVMLTGCEDGDGTMPLPRLTCTQVTALYACGRGGTCEQCGNWAIGCPKPLTLKQIPTGSYDKGEPRLACRMKEGDHGLNESAIPEAPAPLR
jgi:hypothetical protein